VAKHVRAKEAPSVEELSFEQGLADLEGVIRDLEDGRLGLNESLERYEVGVKLLKLLHETLNQAERRILLLTGLDENGVAETQPFDDEAMSLEEKQDQRSRRRSSSAGRAGTGPGGGGAGAAGASDPFEGGDDGEVDRQKGLF
jgi:exodeoxyribonuclease VII small subunit